MVLGGSGRWVALGERAKKSAIQVWIGAEESWRSEREKVGKGVWKETQFEA